MGGSFWNYKHLRQNGKFGYAIKFFTLIVITFPLTRNSVSNFDKQVFENHEFGEIMTNKLFLDG